MEWRPIETAPKDGTQILAVANGADNRPLHAIVGWHDPETMWRSDTRERVEGRCAWIGSMGARYGVEFTNWMPLPPPPAIKVRPD